MALPSPAGPRILYLHGFASGPGSYKGVSIAAHYAARGVEIERLDLRVPSFENLRVSAGIATVRAAIGHDRERVVLFGSSLGGLTACRVAEDDARVAALVLMAPAFRLMERWRQRMGEAEYRAWEERGTLEVDDYTTKRKAEIDFGFALDAEEVDARGGGWPDVRVPVLIVHGRRDAVVDVELSREFSRSRRHVRLVEVDDGHELTASLPRIVTEADAFLTPFLGPPGAEGR
jgi:pimeloyl-ACP methyl ester carboxylesterase